MKEHTILLLGATRINPGLLQLHNQLSGYQALASPPSFRAHYLLEQSLSAYTTSLEARVREFYASADALVLFADWDLLGRLYTDEAVGPLVVELIERHIQQKTLLVVENDTCPLPQLTQYAEAVEHGSLRITTGNTKTLIPPRHRDVFFQCLQALCSRIQPR